MLQSKAIPLDFLQVALHTQFLCSFTVLATCKSVSTTSFLVTKSSITYTISASSKFKMNSTCMYSILIINACTKVHPATLTL